MKIAYFDCFSGISGDMCLGALLAAGVDAAAWRGELAKLPLSGYEIRQEKIQQNGITAANIFVDVVESDQPERHLADIVEIVQKSALSEEVKEKSIAVFQRLAVAEARVHDTVPERIHFHEVGAVDAVIDVVGTVVGLSLLGVERVCASPLPMGKGFIKCRHGLIPSPAPATMEVLKNVPVYGSGIEAELVTPTGAALIATLAADFTELPPMVVQAVGYGSGKKVMNHPNLLRVVLGDSFEFKQPPAYHRHTHGHHEHGPGRHYHGHHHSPAPDDHSGSGEEDTGSPA
ncbi:MAG: LarC family nickel insertion protein [Peptococcaceae bacterium]|nr:LarC family nickel insertion protein [Peptococcaceae bacterium]